MSGQLHAMVALLLGKKNLFQLSRRMGGPNSQSGCFGVEKNLSPYMIQIWFFYTDILGEVACGIWINVVLISQ